MLLGRCRRRAVAPTSMVGAIVEVPFVDSVVLLVAVDGRVVRPQREPEPSS